MEFIDEKEVVEQFIEIRKIRWSKERPYRFKKRMRDKAIFNQIKTNLALGVHCTPILLRNNCLLDGFLRLLAYIDAGETEIPYRIVK